MKTEKTARAERIKRSYLINSSINLHLSKIALRQPLSK